MEQSDVHFDAQTLYQGQFKVTYRGVPAYRCPFDYLIYQMLICKVKPDLVIELGTNFGGSSLYISDLLKFNAQKGVVHTIDIKNKVTFESDNSILFFRDGWQNYDVQLAKKYQNIMIIDDASHQYQGVLEAWKKFSPLVPVGSYYIIEDGIIDELKLQGFDGGPLRAIKEILSFSEGWEIDRQWCDFFGKNATFNVDGYLKRSR